MSKVNIYTPTYHRFEKTMTSLKSIMSSLDKTKHDVVLYIGDNNSPTDMKDTLKSFEGEKVKAYFSEKNVGKAAIINHLHFKFARPCEYVVSIDSDMIVPDIQQNKWIDTMIDALDKSMIGMVVAEQLEGCCHVKHMLEERMFAGHKFLFQKNGSFGAIAGGCLMMTASSFNAIHGYHVLDVYNGDDALIMKKTKELLHRNIGVLVDIALIHPHEDNQAYQQWKSAKAHGGLPNGPDTKGFFDAQ